VKDADFVPGWTVGVMPPLTLVPSPRGEEKKKRGRICVRCDMVIQEFGGKVFCLL